MPIYVFVCEACDHQFEKIVRTGVEVETCPECGQEADRGIETPSKFVWGKGGGWS